MKNKLYDAVIIGAGSVGVPLALELAKAGIKVLTLDKNPSQGQGQNKAAIGGIRATFSDPGKIKICQKSLKILSTWQEIYGDHIGWQQGGYCFPVYSEDLENTLKELLIIQQKYQLNIKWVDKDYIKDLIPGINTEGLRGGTYSPEDGSVSPLKTIAAFYRKALQRGAEFHFNENLNEILIDKGKIKGVKTQKDTYETNILIIASGAEARETGRLAGLDIPVHPDTHEAGITEPVKNFFSTMIVDLRERPGSGNFYFYQNYDGQIVFSMTPSPQIWDNDRRTTSGYLPIAARRIIELIPRLKNIRVRRTWRGLYPMTPDGIPIVDKVREIEGLYLTVGLCGQGLMLGPGIAETIAPWIISGRPQDKEEILKEFTFYRDYSSSSEVLK